MVSEEPMMGSEEARRLKEWSLGVFASVVEVEVVTVGGRNVPTGGGLGQGGGGSLGAGTPLRARKKVRVWWGLVQF